MLQSVKILFAALLCFLQFSFTVEAAFHLSDSFFEEEHDFILITSNTQLQQVSGQFRISEKSEGEYNKVINKFSVNLASKAEIKNSLNIKKSKEFSFQNISQIYLITKFSTST